MPADPRSNSEEADVTLATDSKSCSPPSGDAKRTSATRVATSSPVREDTSGTTPQYFCYMPVPSGRPDIPYIYQCVPVPVHNGVPQLPPPVPAGMPLPFAMPYMNLPQMANMSQMPSMPQIPNMNMPGVANVANLPTPQPERSAHTPTESSTDGTEHRRVSLGRPDPLPAKFPLNSPGFPVLGVFGTPPESTEKTAKHRRESNESTSESTSNNTSKSIGESVAEKASDANEEASAGTGNGTDEASRIASKETTDEATNPDKETGNMTPKEELNDVPSEKRTLESPSTSPATPAETGSERREDAYEDMQTFAKALAGMKSAEALKKSPNRPHPCKLRDGWGRLCKRRFVRPYDLLRHQETVHGTGDAKTYQCALCGNSTKRFSRSDSLSRHIRRMHRMDPEVVRKMLDSTPALPVNHSKRVPVRDLLASQETDTEPMDCETESDTDWQESATSPGTKKEPELLETA